MYEDLPPVRGAAALRHCWRRIGPGEDAGIVAETNGLIIGCVKARFNEGEKRFFMMESKLFASFNARESTETLPQLCISLLASQQNSWPQLVDGYTALKTVRVRDVRCSGYSVLLQFNPRRIVSSGAEVGPDSIRRRKCFLCFKNLPAEQKGVLYKNKFLVLCNPAPILDRHYTIAHVRHTPQQFAGFVRAFLEFAKDLSPTFTVFYNGPKCGASAPDHMHFQAGPTGAIPIEIESGIGSRRQARRTLDDVSVYCLNGLGRQVIVLEGEGVDNVESVVSRLIASMKTVIGISEEPMLNALCSYANGSWRLIVFPRRRHRPDVYFKEGDDKVLISPASMDLGGLVVTPVEKDFNTVDAPMIETIFNEVSLDENKVDRILDAL